MRGVHSDVWPGREGSPPAILPVRYGLEREDMRAACDAVMVELVQRPLWAVLDLHAVCEGGNGGV